MRTSLGEHLHHYDPAEDVLLILHLIGNVTKIMQNSSSAKPSNPSQTPWFPGRPWVLSVSAPLSSYNPASILCGWCCVTFLNPVIVESLKSPFHRWAEPCWVPNVLAPLWVLPLLTQS